MNGDYYVKVDNENLRVSIHTYIFNIRYPNGIEKTLVSLGYNEKSGYTFKEAKKFMMGLCDKLNRHDFNKEAPVWRT